jgi:hypothetical protein
MSNAVLHSLRKACGEVGDWALPVCRMAAREYHRRRAVFMGLPAISDNEPLNCVCGCPPHDGWCHGGCGGCSIYEADNGDDGRQFFRQERAK